MDKNFVALDLETANPNLSSICQIAIVVCENGVLTETWSTLINPEDEFFYINQSIHGISEDDTASAPSFKDVYDKIAELLTDKVVITHTGFDQAAMNAAIQKNKLKKINYSHIDSSKLARRTWEDVRYSGYGLSQLARKLKITFKHHDALEDATTTAKIVLRAIDDSGIGISEWVIKANKKLTPTPEQTIVRKGLDTGPLSGETIVFTGALEIPRKEASQIAATAGCDVEDKVNKKTTIIVIGNNVAYRLNGHEKSAKHRKAEELIQKGQSIRMLSEDDFKILCAIND